MKSMQSEEAIRDMRDRMKAVWKESSGDNRTRIERDMILMEWVLGENDALNLLFAMMAHAIDNDQKGE